MATREVEAIVVGGGIGGLTAAYEFTRMGLRPVVVEARGYTGGLIAGARIGGLQLDIGAEAWALRRPHVGELVAEVGLGQEVPAGSSWVYGTDQEAVQFPERSMLGIPQDPCDADVVRAIGEEGARLAGQDLRAPMGEEDARRLAAGTVADLVYERMGARVLDRLVRPITGGIHAAEPSSLSVAAVLPGLPAALLIERTLGGAIAALRAAAPPGGPVASVDGTMASLPQRLQEIVLDAGGQVLTRTGARSLRRAADGVWELAVTPTRPAAAPSDEPVPAGAEVVLRSSRIVLAAGAGAGERLVASTAVAHLPRLELTRGAPITHLTMVLDCAELDSAPRGSGLLVAAGTAGVAAKALTHLTRKWPSAARQAAAVQGAGEHLHALRLSYGRAGEAPPDVDLTGALRDAATLLGVRLDASMVREHRIIRWSGALAPATPAARRTAQQLDERVAGDEQLRGLRLAGAWVAGTGIAAIVPHARAAARSFPGHTAEDRIR